MVFILILPSMRRFDEALCSVQEDAPSFSMLLLLLQWWGWAKEALKVKQ